MLATSETLKRTVSPKDNSKNMPETAIPLRIAKVTTDVL
jgi:hypothetical protein